MASALLIVLTGLARTPVWGAPPTSEPAPESAPATPAAADYVPTQIEGVRGGLIYCVDVQQNTHDIYFASETMRGGFWGLSHEPNNGTWKSDNGGESWQYIGPGGRNVQVSQNDPGVIYANDRYGLYKTTDGGKTWKTILPGRPRAKVTAPDVSQPPFLNADTAHMDPRTLGYHALDLFNGDHNIVYAGGNGFLYVSRDGGVTWTRHEDLPTGEKGAEARIVALAIHPTDPDTVYLAFSGAHNSPGGVWKSTDGGRTLKQIYDGSAGRGYRGDIVVAPSDPNVIYCASAVSHDGGKTWKPVQGIGSGWEAIAVHPKDANVAFYTRHGLPVCATVTGGDIFFQVQGVDRNYDGTEVEGVAIDGGRDIVWAGGDSIWKGADAASGKVRLVRATMAITT